MISTRNLSALPDIGGLRKLLRSLAMLDAILQPEWQFRFYSFDSFWSADEQMGSMRNGQGDDFFALFNRAGCWLKGFVHTAPMTPYRGKPKQVWRGVADAVPAEFARCLREPAFAVEDATFCIWRRYGDSAWQRGEIAYPPDHSDPDGSEYLLSPLDGRPESYREWAAWYFSKPALGVEAVRQVYQHRPLTDELVRLLNPAVTLDDVESDMAEIGYPSDPAS